MRLLAGRNTIGFASNFRRLSASARLNSFRVVGSCCGDPSTSSSGRLFLCFSDEGDSGFIPFVVLEIGGLVGDDVDNPCLCSCRCHFEWSVAFMTFAPLTCSSLPALVLTVEVVDMRPANKAAEISRSCGDGSECLV